MNVEALIEKWTPTIRKSDHIYTWTGYPELAYLCEMASQSSMAIEIGVYLGRSSKVMLDANPDLRLWSVDPGLVAGVFETAQYFMREEIAAGRLTMLREFTKPGMAKLLDYVGKMDLIFIDDGHLFEDVCCDIFASYSLLRVGGLLCGHDYESSKPEEPVTRAVKKMVPDHHEPVPRIWAHVKPVDRHISF